MNDKSAVKEDVVELRVIRPLMVSEIRARETGVMWNVWEATAEAGTPIEDILRIDFWRNVSAKFQANDTIEIMEIENAWSAELKVRQAWHSGAEVVHKIKPIIGYPNQIAGSLGSDYEVLRNPRDGIHIRRKSNKQVTHRHLPSVPDAQRQIQQLDRVGRS